MPKFRLTKVTPDYDEPGVYALQNYEFRSIASNDKEGPAE